MQNRKKHGEWIMNSEIKHTKSLSVNLIILSAFLVLSPKIVPAQNASRWIQTNGPEGGIMHSVAIHPNNNNILFSCGVGKAVFKSNDAGENWITQGIINDHHNQILEDLIINPANPNTMYLRGGRGIYKSLDAGRTWNSVSTGIDPCHLNITSLGIDHSNPQVLYAGTYSHCPDEVPGAMYKSQDGGESWIHVTSTLNFPIHTQVIDLACYDSLIYLSVINVEEWGGGKLYISRNGGQSWEEMESVFRPGHFHQSIYIDKETPNIAYLGFASNDITMLEGDYLLKTSDKGKTWQSLVLPALDANVKVMGKDKEQNILYVGSGAYLYKSLDEGKTWSEITPPWRGSNEATHIAIDSTRNTLFIASPFAGGIVKSNDGGLNWRLVQNGLLNTNVALLTVKNEPGSQTLYAGSSNGGVFVSTDYGDTWSRKRPDGDNKVYVDELLYNIPSHSFY
ncbi:hypothetical protein GF373_00630, partial [bacterium]|nr:hypothetical protein [bacterium]